MTDVSLVRGWKAIVLGLMVGGALLAAPTAVACELAEVTGCDPTEPPAPAPPAPPVPAPEIPVQPPAALPPDTDAAEARLLQLINDDRRANGLVPMSARGDVEEIATGHSGEMAAAKDIWHNDAFFAASTKRRLRAARVGENVALNRTADDAHRKLMASPQHRANILDPGYSVVGIAVAADEDGRLYITEDFVEPAKPPPPPSPQPQPIAMRAAPSQSPPSVAAAPAAPVPQPVIAATPDDRGGPIELAAGPMMSLGSGEAAARPWPAYLLAGALLLAVAVGFRKVAC